MNQVGCFKVFQSSFSVIKRDEPTYKLIVIDDLDLLVYSPWTSAKRSNNSMIVSWPIRGPLGLSSRSNDRFIWNLVRTKSWFKPIGSKIMTKSCVSTAGIFQQNISNIMALTLHEYAKFEMNSRNWHFESVTPFRYLEKCSFHTKEGIQLSRKIYDLRGLYYYRFVLIMPPWVKWVPGQIVVPTKLIFLSWTL